MEPKTISDVIPELNSTYLIPAIQREFVWDTDQILDLFDSILRDYPIGSLLLSKVRDDRAKNEIKYKFVSDYIEEPNYPREIDDVNHHNPKWSEDLDTALPPTTNLVIDGQQRLTALNIGLSGSFCERKFNARKDDVDSWVRKRLYLNLLSNPNRITEGIGRRYHLEFKNPVPEDDTEHYWYPVSEILQYRDNTDFSDYIFEVEDEIEQHLINENPDLSAESVRQYKKWAKQNLDSLWTNVHDRDHLNFFTDDTEDHDRILDIFIRINQGGTQLQHHEILLSLATSEWQQEEPFIVAREAVPKLRDRLNREVPGGNEPFTANFVLRSLLTCSGMEIQYRLSNFSAENLENMKEVWLTDRFRDSLEEFVNLMRGYDITISHVHSPLLSAPPIYFLYKHDSPPLGWTNNQGHDARRDMLYWLCAAKLKRLSRLSSAQIAEVARDEIDATEDVQFPMEQIDDRLRKGYGESIYLSKDDIDSIFDEATYNTQRGEFLLHLLRFPESADPGHSYEADHIFPQSKVEQEHEDLMHRVGNLQFLRDDENLSKHSSDFSDWLRSRTDEYREKHYIPISEDGSLYQLENFPEFVEKRESLIRDHLLETCESLKKTHSE